ncbi:ABC transporter substrate-binding protein [Loktanella sp. DJP18]|uniref:ABC transporter substrate-binding protein n=1 Tax=Loktanella sp. DJP18 TaxID=3409788 RepID=UPI003BB495E3
MTRLFALLLAMAGPATAQEAVTTFQAGDVLPATVLAVRSTTDIDVFAPVLDAFVSANPTVAVRYEQWGSNALYAVTRQACDAGQGSIDAVISSGVHQMVDLVNRACAQPYVSPLTQALPSARRWRDEIWGITQEAAVTIYNKDLVPAADVPHSRFDLLDLMRRRPETYRNRIATYDIEASGLGDLFAFMDSQQATTFGGLLEGFARVDAVATCCSAEIIAGVASGRYLIAYNVLGSYLVDDISDRVGVIAPQDYTLILSRAYLIPESAPHAALAARLLDFILSARGQAILADSRLVQPASADEQPLPDSARRPIPIAPTLLVAMDQARRRIFVDTWRKAFGDDR